MHNKFTFSLLFVFLFNIYIIYGQQQSLNPNLITYPVSPEAARLGSFGNVPVNLFYGRLEKNIPLFNGNIGDFNLPIQLSYNYAGNRLEETPSIIGLGWQLNLGGVVSREVRGLPDEHPRGFNNAAVKEVVNNYLENNSILQHNANKLATGFYDSEADKYSLSVNGIHFSFKIGIDGNPAFLSKHDYKINIIRNTNNNQIIEAFILTDTSANQYFFEQKEINEPYSGYSSFFEENFPVYTSSWQLSKIILNNQKEIIFNYDNNDYISYNFYANVEIRHTSPPTNDVYNLGCTSDIIKRKILKSISCSNFNINFNYIKLNNYEVYDKMSISDMNNKIVDSYGFSYSGNRNLLDSITKNNMFFYGFEYNGSTSLPDFINSIYSYPNNQDDWGFENDANNIFPLFIPGTIYNADKNPDFQHTVKGALKTIKYQTGGITEIIYEQNSIVDSSITGNEGIEPNVGINLKFKSDFLPDAPSVKESIFTKTFDYDVIATLSHYIENVNFIDLSIQKIADGLGSGYVYNDLHDHSTTPYYILAPHARSFSGIEMPLIETQLNEISQHDSNCMSFNNCSVTYDSGGKFMIPAGTYEFKIRTDYNRTQNVKAEIALNFYDPVVAIDTQNASAVAVGGIRVKSTMDYSLTGEPFTKNYVYNAAISFNDNLFYTLLKKETCCAENVGGGFPFTLPITPNVLSVSSRARNLSMQNNSPLGYLSVLEFPIRNESIETKKFLCTNCGGNSNWDEKRYTYLAGTYGAKKLIYPEGYKVTEFYTPKLKSTEFPFIPSGTDLSIGLEESKIVYSNNTIRTDNKKLIEESSLCFDTDNTNYQPSSIVSNPNYPKSLKVDYKVRLIDNSQITLPFTVNDFFYFKEYKEFDLERFIYSKKTTEYYNDQPLEKNMTIEYDSHFKQKKITTSYNADNFISNEIFYPYDFTDNVSQEMVNKNFISPILQVIDKKNSTILETTKFDFGQISNNLFKPFSFSKSKGINFLEKRNIFGYDLTGNIIATINAIPTGTSPGGATLYEGPTTTMIWGYNRSLLVAKIESSSYVTVPETLIAAIETASDSGTEASLLNALAGLRTSLPNAMVTTYTHIPLVGVSTITDPKGDKITYEYDQFNRLKSVKDKNGNILIENEYHYKN